MGNTTLHMEDDRDRKEWIVLKSENFNLIYEDWQIIKNQKLILNN